MDFHTLRIRLSCLSVLRNLQNSPLVKAYQDVLEALSQDIFSFGQAYATLCECIYRIESTSKELQNLIICDENAITQSTSRSEQTVLDAATLDLQTLNALIALSSEDILHEAQQVFADEDNILQFMPSFASDKSLTFTSGEQLASFYQTNGFGFFAKANSFIVTNIGNLSSIPAPDCIDLSDLKGYARQKDQVITNTLAFLDNKPANNILLYGDKGTGKSSTIKAVANEFANRGLKIIELSVHQIRFFPTICEQVSKSPFPVIVFLDDLSFERDDDNFAALKAFIEGGLAGKPKNMLIYATSNRRHLIRENFSDRMGDDIHRRDTLETVTSLSDRFGLEITFSVPDKDEYLSIVDELAEEYGINLPAETLHTLAERFALRRNGRSPRTARQFLSYQLTQQL